jgi:hypothetical protein
VKVKQLLFSRHLSSIASSSSYSSSSFSLSLLLIVIVLLRSFLEDVDDATTVKASKIEKIAFDLCAITTRTAQNLCLGSFLCARDRGWQVRSSRALEASVDRRQ